jgi:hypothetical protein
MIDRQTDDQLSPEGCRREPRRQPKIPAALLT